MRRTARALPPLLLLLLVSDFAAGEDERGRRLYLEHCAVCHGRTGDGEGPEANRLSVPPRDLTRGLYEYRSTPSGALPLDADLFRTLSRGIPGTAMIPQTYLSRDQRWTVIQYIKSLSQRFRAENPAEPVPIPLPPDELGALVEEGRRTYAEAGCVTCHGERGTGDGPSAATLEDSKGRPTRPTNLVAGPFGGGARPEDIYRTLATGLDGTPMPSYREALTERQLWALVAYVRSLRAPTARRSRGMMGMMGTNREERLGRMIEMHNRMRGGLTGESDP